MRHLPILLSLFLLLAFTQSCHEEKKVDVGKFDAKRLPTMRTTNVNTLISDSGVTKYRIVSPLWLVYEDIDTPYWHFPEGLYLRSYDFNLNVIATVACDSAYYFKSQRLWRLDGRVEITRAPKDLFQTQQLFWDERKHLLYTDKFIHIENLTHMLEGDGFRADDRLTKYTILKPKGIFPINNPSSGGISASSPAQRAGAAADQPMQAVTADGQ